MMETGTRRWWCVELSELGVFLPSGIRSLGIKVANAGTSTMPI